MSETKTFQASVVVSLASGMTLCPFEKIHECAEWVAGHPIWTHEFASKALNARLRDPILFQHPWVGDVDTASVRGDSREALALAARLDRVHGEVSLAKGDEERTADPMETLRKIAGDKPIIPLIIGEEEDPQPHHPVGAGAGEAAAVSGATGTTTFEDQLLDALMVEAASSCSSYSTSGRYKKPKYRKRFMVLWTIGLVEHGREGAAAVEEASDYLKFFEGTIGKSKNRAAIEAAQERWEAENADDPRANQVAAEPAP